MPTQKCKYFYYIGKVIVIVAILGVFQEALRCLCIFEQ